MDLTLVATVILAALGIPYAVEVGYQVWLQAQFLVALPAPVRAALPRHPRRPWLSFLASLRFQIAVLRYALHDLPEDSATVVSWKRRMRASIIRESILVGGLVVAIVVLLVLGWRPAWP
jgi:hypothetical protein